MKNWKHINMEQRKVINSCLTHSYKLKEIGALLHLDPTSISKEIKRNRTLSRKGTTQKVCTKLDRYPYVCNGCALKYTVCSFDQYTYNVKKAEEKAELKKISSRRGIDMDSEEFARLDERIKEGVANGESIYHIVKNTKDIRKSVSCIYRYIHRGILKTKKMDLPCAVSYKKRKKNKKYEYSENRKIDRSNRTYVDYLAHMRSFPNEFVCQLDFLGSIKSDSKSILTLTIPVLHFVYLWIVDKPNAQKVVQLFHELEEKIGTENFKKLFSSILTDRDPSFSDYEGMEHSAITGEQITHLYYCDPYVSYQKANVENMNKQLRKYFPKGKSIDHLTAEDVRAVNSLILRSRVASLDGASPEEAFIRVFGLELYNKLMS